MASKPRVFTIPASAPFLPTLIDALLDDRLGLNFKIDGDPLRLAQVTLYLPTRRACRLARDVFRQRSDAAVLPRIVPIGDVDADEIAFAEAAAGEASEQALELKDALGGLERRMVLAELILKWAGQLKPATPGEAPLVAANPALALLLAADLARLMDDMTTRQVSFDKLTGLVPPEMDEHWQRSFAFLKFVRQHWPAILDEAGKSEPAERRDKLIEAERARLAKAGGPVIAAGSTGSMPATAALLEAIAKLPQGAVVLPGLDTDLDDASWKLIGDGEDAAHGHPQFAMHALLDEDRHRARGGDGAGAARTTWPRAVCIGGVAAGDGQRSVADATRRRRLRRSRRSCARRTWRWSRRPMPRRRRSPSRSRCARRWRQPGKTAALVTPDRALARRVMAALSRWSVPVDDSGGDALADTPLGVFARLVAEAALDGLAPVRLLAMLKHPLCRADNWAVAALERAILRGPRPKAGTEGLRMALLRFREELGKWRRKEPSALHGSDPRTDMKDGETRRRRRAGGAVAERAAAAGDAWRASRSRSPPSRSSIATRWRRCSKRSVSTRPRRASWTRSSTPSRRAGASRCGPRDYAEMFQAALADGGVVRPREQDVRVRIYGPLEARLQSVDLMVLGGLTEGVLAAGDARRSVAQPADAAGARPRPAGAAHRPVGARFRAGAGREGGRADARGARRRRADGRLALRAAARGGGGRGALGRGDRTRRAVSRLGAATRPAGYGAETDRPPRAEAAARRAAEFAVGHRDRDAAARSVFDLRAARAAACARSTRSTRRSARATAAP